MKNIAVIHKSRYGSIKRYAKWIADELGAVLYRAARKLGICSVLFNRDGYDYSGLRVESFGQLERLLI